MNAVGAISVDIRPSLLQFLSVTVLRRTGASSFGDLIVLKSWIAAALRTFLFTPRIINCRATSISSPAVFNLWACLALHLAVPETINASVAVAGTDVVVGMEETSYASRRSGCIGCCDVGCDDDIPARKTG